ncbi:hypothetical protein DFH11DRAFT_1731511 [Phellopilus nigrolimitatus]|nr:hypothetical protein DFH11DRAFT_1731511 [Phellopilus nigrolimitatus]
MAGLLRPDGTPNRDAEHLCVHADYDLSVSTETLFNLCEAVLTLLGVPFSIRKVPPVTEDPAAARRRTHATSSSSRSGFTCRNDIFEAIMVSQAIDAAMVCGMDWDEHNGFFIFSDRWRTRDNNGDSSGSSSCPSPPPQARRVTPPARTSSTTRRRSTPALPRGRAGHEPQLDGHRAVPQQLAGVFLPRPLAERRARGRACRREARRRGGLGLGFNLGWGAVKPMESAVAAGENARRRHAKRVEEVAEEGEEAPAATG